jgi:hypothetical protein
LRASPRYVIISTMLTTVVPFQIAVLPASNRTDCRLLIGSCSPRRSRP